MIRKSILLLFLVSPLYAADPFGESESAATPVASSQTTRSISKIGRGSEWYVGFVVPYKRMSGDFDGNRFYSNDTYATVVPTLDPAFGWGLTLGLKSRAYDRLALALEGSFLQSRHNGQWAGVDYKSIHRELNIDLKVYGYPKEKLQPYILIGYSIPSVEVKEGSVDAGGGLTDGTYHGYGLNLGVGMLCYLTDRFALHFQPTFRLAEYTELEIHNKLGELNDGLSASEFSFQVGATFRFQS